ncbi:hypothetical protein KDD17_10285 [Sulfitobacter albidus]|uniref:Uncharacterized protein n=1 Tax=Sulfitobacter albidus TaxID=2829501 RepID=A0A975PNT6_9RHOB|nr:hypothetical protein [Sulfitobacter albidus]QUJ78094.1 hypothetical protein KDD17_10285 [Sulfitobacter albidus]
MQGCGSVLVVLPSSLFHPGTLPDQERKIHLAQLFRFLGPPLQLCGHADDAAHWGYGKGASMARLKQEIEKVEYKGLDLSHLKNGAWSK